MKICSKCKAENIFDEAKFCKNCGAPLFENENNAGQEDSLDFVITESQAPQTPNFMDAGESKQISNDKTPPEREDERLDISSPSDILDMGVEDHELMQNNQDKNENEEIDFAKDPLFKSNQEEQIPTEAKSTAQKPDEGKPAPVNWDEGEAFPAKSNMKSGAASDDDIRKAQEELRKMANDGPSQPQPPLPENKTESRRPDAVIPIDDPALGEPVKTTSKKRGVAFYKNNNIQLIGNPFLHEGDEILVNEKSYLLRPKKMDKRLTIGLFAAAVFVILVGIGSQFISSGLSDDGTIIGMVLDEYGYPYLEGAIVTIPELNKKTKSNAQGFFKFEMIPTGTYTIRYDLSGKYVGQGNTTVAGGQTTLTTFGDVAEIESELPVKENASSNQPVKTVASKPTETGSKKEIASNTTSTAKANKNQRGQIKLAANVENARLVLEGQILGSGNMTFSEIRPGQRKIKIDKPGYETYSATITVSPGETTIVNANLKKAKSSNAELTADDYLERGNDLYSQDKFKDAVADYTKAINLEPGSPSAYEQRALAYIALKNYNASVTDYIKAGEIYRMQKKYNNAIKVFTLATDLQNDNIPAILGRAGAYIGKGDYSMSLNDYDNVLNQDKKNYQALYGSGLCYFKLSEHKKADKYFKRAYKINENDPYLYQYMMLTQLARDDINEMQDTYAKFKTVANAQELAEFKSSSRFEPILRLIKEENR